MSAQPGSLDFSKLAAQATKELETESSASKEKVKVAATEGGIPAPSNEVVQKTNEQQNSQEETVAENLSEQSSNEGVQDETVSPNVQTDQKANNQEQVKEQILALPDTAKVKVKIDGQETVVSYGEYKDLLRKNATVTQRMQNFAKDRDAFNAEVQKTLQVLEARERALQEQSAKKDPLYETLLNALKGQIEPKPRDPNEIVTLGDIQKEREKLAQEFESKREADKKNFESQLVEAAQNLQTQASRQREWNSYLDGIRKELNSKDYEGLREVNPHLEAGAIFHMKNSGAQNLDEAIEASVEYLKERNAAFRKHTISQQQEQQKNAVKQKMESNDGINPSVAQREKTPKEKATQFVGKNGKLDWNKMSADALRRMNDMN